MAKPLPLLAAGVQQACAMPIASAVFPPVLSPAQLALLVDRTTGAIYHWPGADKLRGVARRRGKHWLIWRDRALAMQAGRRFSTTASGGISLSVGEANAAFDSPEMLQRFPPFLAPETLAELLGIGRSTLYRWIALGRLEGTFLRRSDGIRFVRNQVLLHLFNTKDWLA